MTYEIKNSFIKVKIKSFGAELNSLQKIDDNLEYIWQGDKQYWGRSSPVLFPIIGKLKDDSYFYKNQKFNMSQHGFARDKDFEIVEIRGDFIEFKLSSDTDSLSIYPFLFELFISYKLERTSLLVSYKVVNKSKDNMLFSIGAHPAFNWPLKDCEIKKEYFLEFENINTTKRYFLNEKGLVFDNCDLILDKNRLFLNEELFKDDALVFNDLNIKKVSFKNVKNDNFVKLDFENFPYLGVWSKPTGSPFVCIEPWFGIADEEISNQRLEDKKGMINLAKNDDFCCSYQITI